MPPIPFALWPGALTVLLPAIEVLPCFAASMDPVNGKAAQMHTPREHRASRRTTWPDLTPPPPQHKTTGRDHNPTATSTEPGSLSLTERMLPLEQVKSTFLTIWSGFGGSL